MLFFIHFQFFEFFLASFKNKEKKMVDEKDAKKVAGAPDVGNDPLNPQNIHVLVMNHNKDEAKDAQPKKQDPFNKCLGWSWYFVKLFLLEGLGLAAIILSNTRNCQGQPGLLTFLWGVGIVLCWLGFLVIMNFHYFQYHKNEHAGVLFRTLIAFTQLCIFGLSIYGVYECGLETINRGIQDGLISNGVTGASVDAYNCDIQIYEIGIVAVIIGFLYVAGLLYRIFNYYRVNTSILQS